MLIYQAIQASPVKVAYRSMHGLCEFVGISSMMFPVWGSHYYRAFAALGSPIEFSSWLDDLASCPENDWLPVEDAGFRKAHIVHVL